MKRILFSILMFVCVITDFAQEITDYARLASQYYHDKEYGKAVVLYEELYRNTQFKSYFIYYINCLAELGEYNKVERELRRNFKTTRDPVFLVFWGNVLNRKGETEKGKKKYEEAINSLVPSYTQIASLSNLFIQQSEFEMARQTLLRGRELMPGEQFHHELARLYLYQRNYEAMFNEYLALIKFDPSKLAMVKSRLQTAFRMDIQDRFQERMKIMILQKIQTEPNVQVYCKLLVWHYLQESNFKQALAQAIAMDKRWKTEDEQILNLSNVAGRNGAYDIALSGFQYIISRREQSKFYLSAIHDRMKILYLQFVENPEAEKKQKILFAYDQSLEKLGMNAHSINLVMDRAHLLAFYFHQSKEAEQSLREALVFPRLTRRQKGLLKNSLADVMICNGDFWEASLLYAQVAEENKSNALGDDVKLKRARLAWYMGDIEWAHAQLDVLKASTSKTIANDAMNLSLLIEGNSENDTIRMPLKLYARADLWQFRNKLTESLAVLDSLVEEFPCHPLHDEVLYRKAKIYQMLKEDQNSEKYLSLLLRDYPRSHFADDALMKKAKLVEKNLARSEEAEALYKKLLVEYPASIFIVEARKRYRILRGH